MVMEETPGIGEIRSAANAGYEGKARYIWHACVDCGKQRWVQFWGDKPKSVRCLSCASRIGQHGKTKDRHSTWKGGRFKEHHGYVYVRLYPGDFFYPMIDANSYVREQRLMMARHLGRCLLPNEVVHHENGVKDDNRLDNLVLLTKGQHRGLHNRRQNRNE